MAVADPTNQNVMVPVRVDGGTPPDSAVLLEGDEEMEAATGVKVVDALLGRIEGGETQLLLSNLSEFTQKLEGGTYLGRAAEVQVVTSEDNETLSSPAAVTTHDIEPITTHDIESETDAGYAETVQLSSGHIFHITEGGGTYLGRVTGEDTSEEEDVPTATIPPVTTCPEDEMVPLSSGHVFRVTDELRRECRRKKLLQILQEPDLPPEEKKQLMEFLADNHEAFSLEGERGETDLVEMVIDTGDARPLKQAPRRMPYSVRQEVARQLKEMQHGGVIEPSKSAWASPVVLVRKRDGSHRFCVDYRGLNSLTKADTFPLPRIDELLDQLGKARYFSTIDLASGFWQIKAHPDSQEKTAFVTPQGLFNFKVMPFGLTNAPAVFQRLMQQVVMCLNPDDGPDFISVYLDDILVFSESLSDHLRHLQRVIVRLMDVGLKLKPAKCHFARSELEYLGHTITREGVKTNSRLVAAVSEFPTPRNVREVRQFLGLSSFYRRFIPNFAKIATPLHQLTHKDVAFAWTQDCKEAFDTLKLKLTTAPVLAYPRFDSDFILETDASILGLGAVLSQVQDDAKPHPISYASRALSNSEKNYAITELETLAVVWAISHYHHHLYGHCVTVLTDHSAVKAVLETSNPTGKHARWWTKVYGRGVKEVRIIYRAGRENASADALSRSPQAPAPLEGVAEGEMQISQVQTTDGVSDGDISALLHSSQDGSLAPTTSFLDTQKQDPQLCEIIEFLKIGSLPADEKRARKIALQAPLFSVVDDTLYYVEPKRRGKRVVVPLSL